MTPSTIGSWPLSSVNSEINKSDLLDEDGAMKLLNWLQPLDFGLDEVCFLSLRGNV